MSKKIENEEPHQTPYGIFPKFYNYKQLQDVCLPKEGIQTGPFGSQLHSSDYVFYGTPIITVEHLADNRIIHSNLPRVKDEDKARLSKYILYEGDIVFSRVGSVDRRAIVRSSEDGWLFSGRLLRIRPNKKELDPLFLSYLMGFESFKEYIRKIAVGATMPSLNTKILSEIPICYPNIQVQKAIAHILGTLDDKIELNRRMNETLESIARAIFKSWFIDFDPVRAKADGRQPEGMDAATAALFPSEFETVEGQEIPKGWQVKPIGDVIELAYGKALKEENRISGNIPVYGSNGKIGWHNEKLISGPGIIIGRKGNPGVVTWSHTDFFAIDTTFYVKLRNKKLSLRFFRFLLEYEDLASLGADSAVPGLNRNHVYMSKIVLPDVEILSKFEKTISTLDKMILNNENQSNTLIKNRDTLLPKLLSGELPIDNPEQFTGVS